jgi:hypothetical protein
MQDKHQTRGPTPDHDHQRPPLGRAVPVPRRFARLLPPDECSPAAAELRSLCAAAAVLLIAATAASLRAARAHFIFYANNMLYQAICKCKICDVMQYWRYAKCEEKASGVCKLMHGPASKLFGVISKAGYWGPRGRLLASGIRPVLVQL